MGVDQTSIHCIWCKRLFGVTRQQLQQTHLVRCIYCSAVRTLTEREQQLYLRMASKISGPDMKDS
jgi:DNA-directed RNA polymerase subunit RPC12/RpoP